MNDPNPVDLTNCDREPIHILGSIQPIGFLVALTADWIVARTSANLQDYLHLEPGRMVGQPLADLLTPHAMHELRNRTAMLRGSDAVERLFGIELVPDSTGSTSPSTCRAARS